MPVEIPLSSLGLLTVAEAADLKGWQVRTLQRWIQDGRIPVVVVGGGMRTVYLLRRKDVNRFKEPDRGRPTDKVT